jgi:hypothetical protein
MPVGKLQTDSLRNGTMKQVAQLTQENNVSFSPHPASYQAYGRLI